VIQVPAEVEDKQTLLKQKLKEMRLHGVFSSLHNIDDLKTFMEWHVFPVWDFMSLAKRLQQDFTCVTLPWLPNTNSKAAKLINEIILGEETDVLPNRKAISHFEMYIISMNEIGASTAQIDTFIDAVRNGQGSAQNIVSEALKAVKAHPAIQAFVNGTMDIALNGVTAQVLGSFFYGREDSIPEMFQHLLETWNIDQTHAETFVYYLNRHIELDGDEHGPAVQKIINDKFSGDLDSWNHLFSSAIAAVDLRIALWDALEVQLKENHAKRLSA